MIDIGGLQFDFSNPLLIVLGIVLLASLLLSARGVVRRLLHRSPLLALTVLALNALAYGTVLLILLEPRISHPGTKSVTLVTEGADLSKILRADTDEVYVAPGVAASGEARRDLATANWLLDIGQLQLREPALKSIEVLGYGLESQQWLSLSGPLDIDFEAPAIGGFTGMRWQRFLLEGETLRVNGHFGQVADDGIIQLRLLDPAANTVAETRLKKGQDFSLAAPVKTRGMLEFKLQAWDADKLLSEEVLPLDVGADKPLNIMVEQSSPSYETRQLKDFAAANGHRVRINSDISTGKYINQSANLPADASTTFSPQVLAGQDLLIMDGRAFAALPAARMQWLSDAVENGLGLLLLADSTLVEEFGNFKTGLLNGFSLTPLSDAETTLIPRLPTAGARDWQEPVATAAMQLSATGADVLVTGSDGRDLVVKRATGLGQVGISLISHSHSWLTAGNRAQWSDYWAALFTALARQRADSFLLPPAATDFFRVAQRTAVCAFSKDDDAHIVVGSAQSDSLELQPAADVLRSQRKCAYFWPRSGGWYRIQLLSGTGGTILDQKAIYVFQADQWRDQQRERRVEATSIRAGESKTTLATPTETKVSEPLSRFWLWLILVLCATFLWLERKLYFA